MLEKIELPDSLNWQFHGGLAQIDFWSENIHKLDRYLSCKAKVYPEIEPLLDIPGIGVFSALLILSEIGEIRRFNDAKSLVS
jgi:transposase